MPTYISTRASYSVRFYFILQKRVKFIRQISMQRQQKILSKSFLDIVKKYLDWRTNESSFYFAVY